MSRVCPHTGYQHDAFEEPIGTACPVFLAHTSQKTCCIIIILSTLLSFKLSKESTRNNLEEYTILEFLVCKLLASSLISTYLLLSALIKFYSPSGLVFSCYFNNVGFFCINTNISFSSALTTNCIQKNKSLLNKPVSPREPNNTGTSNLFAFSKCATA